MCIGEILLYCITLVPEGSRDLCQLGYLTLHVNVVGVYMTTLACDEDTFLINLTWNA